MVLIYNNEILKGADRPYFPLEVENITKAKGGRDMHLVLIWMTHM